MDILNFISWIKAGNYRATLPTDVTNLIAVGAKDPSRDDGYLPLSVNAAPLLSVYDKGAVTQSTSISTDVTLDAHNGVITTVAATTAAGASDSFHLLDSAIATDSTILLSVQYGGAGVPVVRVSALAAGDATITIENVGSAALDAEVLIHFAII
jgi:hypothetical protein